MGYKVTRIMALILFLIMITATISLGYAIEWSPEMGLTWNDAIDGNPSIAQASDGKIWVVWHSYRTGNADLFYKVYDSSQVHPWSSEKNLTTNPNTDIQPSVMQAQDGKIWVVWSTNRTGNYEIYYKTSQDNGATWSTDQYLITNLKDDEHPSIMQVANGTIWLAWSANRTGNYEIYYRTSQDNGATWSTDMWLTSTETTNDRNPSITQAANGNLWFVWERDKDQKLHIWYRTYYYNSILNKWMWGGITQVTTAPNTSNYNPSVMPAMDGSIWIAWDSIIGEGQADIYYQTRSPPLFSATTIIQLTYNQGDDFTPSIMQATDETIWIAWASWRTGSSDIYYMTTVTVWNGWTSVGTWLDREDYPANYIYTSITGDRIGNFTFQNVTQGSTWSTVTLRIKTWRSGTDDTLKIYLYNGTKWQSYTVAPPTASAPGSYVDVDVTSFLNTEAKINATKMAIEKLTTGTADTIGVDHAYLSFLGPEFNENVDGRTPVTGWRGWTSVGTWLDREDYPANYIYTSITDDRIGNFTFADIPSGTTWSTVTLRLKTWKSTSGTPSMTVYLYNGISWTSYTVTPTSTTAPGTYMDVDVTSFLNTAEKINAAKMAIEKLSTGTVYVDHAYIRVSGVSTFDANVDGRTTETRHDVAIFSVIPTEVTVTAGQTVSIEIVAQNHGNNVGNFIVRLYADLTNVNESGTIVLSPGQLYKIEPNLTWTASNPGTYKIWAKASTVYGEIYTVDNTFPAILGDVNDDRTVNASDVSVFSNTYGSKPGDSNWNPDCNFDGFNGDNKVDAFDLFDQSKNYGKSQ